MAKLNLLHNYFKWFCRCNIPGLIFRARNQIP